MFSIVAAGAVDGLVRLSAALLAPARLTLPAPLILPVLRVPRGLSAERL
jgi:hypothetical protein